MELVGGVEPPRSGSVLGWKLEVLNLNRSSEEALMGSYVGIDLHRQRSVIVVLNEDGERVSWSRIDNTPVNLARELDGHRRDIGCTARNVGFRAHSLGHAKGPFEAPPQHSPHRAAMH